MKLSLRKKLLEFAKLVKLSGIRNPQLILYGSYAKGRPKPFSDIDVCVITDRLEDNLIKNEVKLRLLALKIDERIDPIIYLKKDFSCEEDPLVFEIKKHGLRVE